MKAQRWRSYSSTLSLISALDEGGCRTFIPMYLPNYTASSARLSQSLYGKITINRIPNRLNCGVILQQTYIRNTQCGRGPHKLTGRGLETQELRTSRSTKGTAPTFGLTHLNHWMSHLYIWPFNRDSYRVPPKLTLFSEFVGFCMYMEGERPKRSIITVSITVFINCMDGFLLWYQLLLFAGPPMILF
jgi:hypothetical protein